jgi:PAS domain S-box-containing protein
MELTLPDEKIAASLGAEIAAARSALEQGEGGVAQGGLADAALWLWDLGGDSMKWDERLSALFGYTETVTNAAWRENRIHPADHDRVRVSLQKATIVNDGSIWSDHYRFRNADGAYVAVTERACVIHDDAGPRAVVGILSPAVVMQVGPGPSRFRYPAIGPDGHERRRG